MTGKVTTQGDRAIRAQVARQWFDLDGSGITIGIISDSFNALGGARENIRSGDLPGPNNPDGYTKRVRVLQDLPTGSDEGRALAQIIFDLAPGAELLFHTTGSDEEGFAQAVRALAAAGADVIVDDILLATSTFFQDGVAAQAINEVTAQGITFVTAAGNNGDRSYESSFRSSNAFTFRGSTYIAHDFDASAAVDLFQDIQIPAGTGIDLIFNWSQPSGTVESDFELFILDSSQLPDAGGNVLRNGTILPQREEDPSQRVSYTPSGDQTVYLLIAQRTDSDNQNLENQETNGSGSNPEVLKWISFANDGDRGTVYQYVNNSLAGGSSTIYGHQNAEGAITVGAVAARQTPALGGNNPSLEDFSSRGSAPILFDEQGNRLLSAVDRQKPELLGPDRVSTTVTGFSTFIGTSAAAPHVAATVALMLQRAGGRGRLTSTQILAAMQQNTLPIANSQPGLLQADTAVLQAFEAEIIGTTENDWLQGSANAENLIGLDGNDTLKGAGGFDALLGNAGNDQLLGNAGNDYLLGQVGNDRLLGGIGRDWLHGGLGVDRLHGGQGNDKIRGGIGRDTLIGGGGRNTLIGGKGRDRFVLDRRGFAQIQDFQRSIDRLILPGNLSFSRITIESQGENTLIKQADRTLARLTQVNSDRLSITDFGLG